MAKIQTAMCDYLQNGIFGAKNNDLLQICEVTVLSFEQVCMWHGNQLDYQLPQATLSKYKDEAYWLSIAPLRWWCIGKKTLPNIDDNTGAILDISHAWSIIRIEGNHAKVFINRFLDIDLRPSMFPKNKIITTNFHHVGVSLWKTESAFYIFLPRGFAVSLWEIMFAIALQFGVTITPMKQLHELEKQI